MASGDSTPAGPSEALPSLADPQENKDLCSCTVGQLLLRWSKAHKAQAHGPPASDEHGISVPILALPAVLPLHCIPLGASRALRLCCWSREAYGLFRDLSSYAPAGLRLDVCFYQVSIFKIIEVLVHSRTNGSGDRVLVKVRSHREGAGLVT